MGFSPKDMEYLNTLRWTVEDVARAFNVPQAAAARSGEGDLREYRDDAADVLGDLHRAGTEVFRGGAAEDLLPMFGEPSLVAEFDTSNIEALRESETERARRIKMYVSAGVMTVEEARAEIGLGSLSSERSV